ncbi:MAG: hypothetical protein WC535_08290 [Candidatus Cloacimonas sp.]
MNFSIKEIKEKFEKDDKVEFSGIVKKVNNFNDKPTKFAIGNQGILITDGNDDIKVIVTIKDNSMIYQKDIEGKKVHVSGKLSEWEGVKNVFGKIEFMDELPEKPEKQDDKNKLEMLKLAIQFAGKEMNAKEVIETAEIFYNYVYGKNIETILKKDSEIPADDKVRLIKNITVLMQEKNAQEMIENILKNQKTSALDELDTSRLKAIESSLEKYIPF